MGKRTTYQTVPDHGYRPERNPSSGTRACAWIYWTARVRASHLDRRGDGPLLSQSACCVSGGLARPASLRAVARLTITAATKESPNAGIRP